MSSFLRPRARAGGAPAAGTATVLRGGRAIVIRPTACAAALAPIRSAVLGPCRAAGLVARLEPLIHEKDDSPLGPCLIAPAGLEAIVVRQLREAGYEVQGPGPTPPPPAPDLGQLAAFDPVDRPVLDFVRAHDLGLIRYDPGRVEPARLIAQVALGFASLSVAVVATREADVRRVAGQLRRYVPCVRWETAEPCLARYTRVVVVTPGAFKHASIRAWARDLVLALDPVEVLGLGPSWSIIQATNARLYGLLDRAARPAPRAADGLAALSGCARSPSRATASPCAPWRRWPAGSGAAHHSRRTSPRWS